MKKLIALMLVLILVLSFAAVVFAEGDGPSPEGNTEPNPDNPVNPESPKTGDFVLMLVPFMALGLFGVIVSARKLIKNH